MLSRVGVTILIAALLFGGKVAVVYAQPTVTAVRTGEHVGLTRLVLDITEKVEFYTFSLADPYRVVVDLSLLDWKVAASEDNRRGVISKLRFGYFERRASRMVIEALGPVEVRRAFLCRLRAIGPIGSSSIWLQWIRLHL